MLTSAAARYSSAIVQSRCWFEYRTKLS